MDLLNLSKGQRLDLTKGNPGLSLVKFSLGWDERVKTTGEADFDPDACAAVLHNSRAWQNPHDLLYYNSNKLVDGNGNFVDDGAGGYKWADEKRPYPFILDGALASSGDNRTGSGNINDKEIITIDLAKLPADLSHIALIVTIYDVEARKQNFGMMNNAFCRIEAPGITTFKPAKADLTEDYSAYTAVIMGYLYRKDSDWKYNAMMKGINAETKGADGKPLGSVNVATICPNLTSLLEVAVVA